MVPAFEYPAARAILRAACAHRLPQFGMFQHDRRRTFFDDFLVTSLDGAFTLAQVNQMTVLVPKNLNFDVARLHHQLFDVDLVVLEGMQGFAGSVAKGRLQVGLSVHPAHSFTPSPGSSLE